MRYADMPVLAEARRLAAQNGLFFVTRPDGYVVYRERKGAPNDRIGRRSSVDGLLQLVKSAGGSKP